LCWQKLSWRVVDYARRNPASKTMRNTPVDREILRSLWKVHILFHAAEGPIVGHWMMEELREHGYRVSPGTLYPLLTRMEKLGWLRRVNPGRRSAAKDARPYRATTSGRRALAEVQERLRELIGELRPNRPA
jgi:PadR family transcriptional regulator PadR